MMRTKNNKMIKGEKRTKDGSWQTVNYITLIFVPTPEQHLLQVALHVQNFSNYLHLIKMLNIIYTIPLVNNSK